MQLIWQVRSERDSKMFFSLLLFYEHKIKPCLSGQISLKDAPARNHGSCIHRNKYPI